MIQVVIAEDHRLVRQGIVKLLESVPDFSVVGEADNGLQAIEMVKSLHPDVVILDITMPKVDGFEALSKINRLTPKPQVVMLSMHADPTLIRQALQSGASCYVVKQSIGDDLLAAVRAAGNGSIFLSSGISGVMANSIFAETPKNILDRLSPREREVVSKIVEGLATREIAELLHTSIKTVEKQRRDAMRKLEVENIASLVRVSLELGLTIDHDTIQ